MIFVLLAISIVLLVVGLIIMSNACSEGVGVAGGIATVIGGFGIVGTVIAAITLGVMVADLSTIDERIAMYQEENTRIETQIAETVQQYQKYESDVFTEVKPESAMTMVALYPELKSDKLVASQIDVYVTNNDTIKQLKDEKIRGRVKRWWLYFGS